MKVLHQVANNLHEIIITMVTYLYKYNRHGYVFVEV